MRRIQSLFVALSLLVITSFGGVLIWSLITQPGTAQDDSGELGGGFGDDFGGGFDDYCGSGRYAKGAEPKEYTQAWCEAIFIQIDTADLQDIRIGGEPLVTPVSEKSVLTAREKLDLLRQLKSKPSCRIIASAPVITLDGQQALMQRVEEVRYSTDYWEGGTAGETAYVIPGTFETREVGMRLNVTPTMSKDGLITLMTLPELSRVVAWKDFGGSLGKQPLFRSWNIAADVYCPDGMTLMMTAVLTNEFGAPFFLDRQGDPERTGAKTAIVLISARILDVPATRQEESEQ